MNKTILIAAGGTGGHIFPGLAVAERLIANNCKVVWVGTINGLESTLVPKNNIPIYYINITGIRGKNLFTKILGPINILVAVYQAIKIINLLKPDVVLGMGGFVSGPVGVAAWFLGKKLIIHEQNAVAGSSNKILSYFADHILESFTNSFNQNNLKKINKKIILTGLPIRQDFLTKLSKQTNQQFNNNILRILVLGGSRGAQFLNQTIPRALCELPNIKILHQSGEKEFQNTVKLYEDCFKNNNYEVKPFIDNMLEAYLNSDLLICRGGAATVFEIMAVGIAAILVPLPWAIDDHQTKNALYLVNNNAGILLQQQDASIEKLKTLIIELNNNREKLYSIQQAAKLLYKQFESRNSAEWISSICCQD